MEALGYPIKATRELVNFMIVVSPLRPPPNGKLLPRRLSRRRYATTPSQMIITLVVASEMHVAVFGVYTE